ncbi:MAG TPA: Clp protease N-terminal domain-containing protein [Actinomycetota bacterium]|nr:Clp protease N-terminal domain-containing protein [Actinomycetota bacterium]
MFERFTDRARRVVVLAQEEARGLAHDYIGTEHILLGLIHEEDGVAAKVLKTLGVSLDEVRRQVEAVVPRGSSPFKGHLPFTPRSKKILELSLREATALGHNYIGTEHILLALAREGGGVAAQILVQLGADGERLRAEVVALLGEGGARAAGGSEGFFARFTDRARRVIVLAQEEARLLNHGYIGTEHMLLGLIHEGDGVAARALGSLGVSLERAREQVASISPRGDDEPGDHIPFTAEAKQTLEVALREAFQLGHNYIGTEHILLGLLRQTDEPGTRVLLNAGVAPHEVRAQVLGLMSGSVASPESPIGSGAVQEFFAAPRCPHCRAGLEQSTAYRVLEVPEHEGTVNVLIMFVFCRACGTTLGTIAPG